MPKTRFEALRIWLASTRSFIRNPKYTVRVGGIELHGVEGLVIEQGLDIALLGMSFLSRVEMKNEGQTMTIMRRF